MQKEFVIECRYQFRSRNGVEWTNWFVSDAKRIPESEIKDALKLSKDFSSNTDKVTKLKHEYRALDADEYEMRQAKFLEHVEECKKDFATIKKMKKPWLAKARKERKKLADMSNDEKVQYLAKKRGKKNDE